MQDQKSAGSQNPVPKSRYTRKNRSGTATPLTDIDKLHRPMRPAPTPFDFDGIHQAHLANGNRYWREEEGDKLIPRNSFVSDFVLGTRGYQASTLFAIWSSLFTVSAMLKRFAWMGWGADKMFANLYLMFVAPAGICKKSTLISYGDKVLTDSIHRMEHPLLRVLREPNNLRGEVTSEALHDIMKPHQPWYYPGGDEDEEGKVRLNGGSNVNIVVSELSTMISKKKYNVGLIQKLTDLFDCADIADRTTRSDGVLRIENVYTTLFGGTTPDQLKYTFPEDALGSGFMSRVIPVLQTKFERSLARPMLFADCPTRDDLADRLAWIGDHAFGEFTFDDDAEEYFTIWYDGHMNRLHKGSEDYQNVHARMDILFRKVAMLIRASRYEFGTNITLDDVFAAQRLLDATYKASSSITEDAHASANYTRLRKVAEYLEKHKEGITKIRLYRLLQRHMTSEDLIQVLLELNDLGRLVIISKDGEYLDRPRKDNHDTYYFRGKSSDLALSDRQAVEDLIQEEFDKKAIRGTEEPNLEPETRDVAEVLAKKHERQKRLREAEERQILERRKIPLTLEEVQEDVDAELEEYAR